MHYLSTLDIIALNQRILADEQQEATTRDDGLLEGALMRTQMAAHYEGADLVAQAALLMQGIALAHAFVDGNKRTALAAGTIFLDLNGSYIASAPMEFGRQIEAMVTRAITLDLFVAWLRERLRDIE
jgi:death-on-curing protein